VTAAHDYPDFQSFPTAASGNLFPAAVQVLAPGTVTAGPLPVASWSALALNIRASAGAAQVNVHHWADAAATILIGGDSWPVRVQTKLTVITPLRGPYVSADITVTSPGALTANTFMQFRSDGAERITYPVGAQVASANARALAASGQDFWDLPSVCAGRAGLKFVPFDATAKLRVRVIAVNELGAFQYYVADLGTPAAGIYQLVEIPDVCCSVEVDNLDGAAPHTYDVALVVPPQ
jgi:hypothetical protein